MATLGEKGRPGCPCIRRYRFSDWARMRIVRPTRTECRSPDATKAWTRRMLMPSFPAVSFVVSKRPSFMIAIVLIIVKTIREYV